MEDGRIRSLVPLPVPLLTSSAIAWREARATQAGRPRRLGNDAEQPARTRGRRAGRLFATFRVQHQHEQEAIPQAAGFRPLAKLTTPRVNIMAAITTKL